MRQTALLLGTLILAACGEKATEPQTGSTAPKPVASVQVTPNTHTLTAIGATQQFQATAKDTDATTISGKTFTWSSSDTTVVRVDAATGLVTALGNGAASIIAVVDGVQGKASVMVEQAVHTVTVTPDSLFFTALGATASLDATVGDSLGNVIIGGDITWVAGDPTVISVAVDGVATSEANGETTVTATADGVTDTTWVAVHQTVMQVTINPDTARLSGPGATEQLSATLVDSLGYDVGEAYPTWESSDTMIAVVDSTGKVRGLAPGAARVHATANAVSDSAFVIVGTSDVIPPELIWFDLNPKEIDVTTSPTEVSFSIEVKDDLAGVETVVVHVESPSGQQFVYCVTTVQNPVPGQVTITCDDIVPQHAEAGDWTLLYVHMIDAVGNVLAVWSDWVQHYDGGINEGGYEALGVPSTLTVNSTSDVIPPELIWFDFTPKEVDVGAGDINVSFSIEMTDELSGVKSVAVQFESPSGQQSLYCTNTVSSPVAGDVTVMCNETVRQYAETGEWTLLYVHMIDAVGNVLAVWSDWVQHYDGGINEGGYEALGVPSILVVR